MHHKLALEDRSSAHILQASRGKKINFLLSVGTDSSGNRSRFHQNFGFYISAERWTPPLKSTLRTEGASITANLADARGGLGGIRDVSLGRVSPKERLERFVRRLGPWLGDQTCILGPSPCHRTPGIGTIVGKEAIVGTDDLGCSKWPSRSWPPKLVIVINLLTATWKPFISNYYY